MLVSVKHIVQRWLGDQLTRLGLPASYMEFPWPTLSDATAFPHESLIFSPGSHEGMYEPRIDPAAEAGRTTSLSHWILLKMLLLLDLIEYLAKKIRAVISSLRLKATKKNLFLLGVLILGLYAWYTFTQVRLVKHPVNAVVEHGNLVQRDLDIAMIQSNAVYNFSDVVKVKKKGKKMGPKKAVKEEKVLLGRPGNNLKSGIVGLANVGKSTLFQAITKCSLGNPANFPYATIEPEEARVIVPDARFDWLCEHYKPKSQVPANLTVYDIAGLTRGASTGAGLGNAFLSHIRAVDAIFQVVRCFDDAEIIHVEGDVDPIRDLTIISEELRIKDIEFVEKALEALQKQTKRGGQSLEMKKLREEEATVARILQWLKDGKDVRKGDWTPKEVEVINPLFLLTAKPVVYLVNLSERDYIRQKNKYLPKVAEWIKENSAGDPVIPLSVSFEDRLTRFENDAESEEECKKLGTKSALPKVIVTMRQVLNLGSFFTTGADEVRQWTIRKGTKAPQAAGVIHTDFEKTFIQAIVFNFETLKEYGDEAAVKAAGKVMTKGKDYVVEDGDILLIKAGAAKG
ncbi:GTP-binding family protein [Paecilomyces variotii No. 5]|uniref:Obg-like ATPase 1 n=1 Tax=Byssochlamys spectabilis (strain No. 5 / NBRC 109023) TaxID=1356009 RepID=V5I1M9_BYSSN|nr:GTP-binding family protein [Paecilomyces variotii No. 5]